MNKRKALVSICIIILTLLVGLAIYKSYSHHKIQTKKEACFDHFMNYWYSFYEQYNADVEMYTRMKKGVILDYIKNGTGRYIYEQVPLYGGDIECGLYHSPFGGHHQHLGTFSMRHYCNIDWGLEGHWIQCRAVGPIELAPDSRKDERWAFWHIYYCGKQLSQIDDYDERLGTDMDYLKSTFH